MTQLNPTIEKFYLSILSYAGLTYSDGIIKNINDKFGPITIDGKSLTLPYFDNLKNPNGRLIFHLLNENYTNPENTIFNFYKKRLVLELNLKLTAIINNLITVASDVSMQQKIKSSKLIDIISRIGETDMTLIENFLNMLMASKKVNEEAYLFDIYLKKNGEINGTPYAAIGKINFIAAKEIYRVLNDKEKDYKVFGCKLRKKDLVALNNIFNILFPDFLDSNKYTEGTNNKIFRYLNILLKTSYMISSRINEICELLEEIKEPSLRLEECFSDHEWANLLEDLYGMANEIRLIPSQIDLRVESKNYRLNVDESKANVTNSNHNQQPHINQQQNSREFVPPSQQYQQSQPIQVQQPQQPLSPEDIIKNNIPPVNYTTPQMPFMYTNTPPTMPNVMPAMNMPYQQLPSWIIQETIRSNNPQGFTQQQPMNNFQYQSQMQPMMQPIQTQVPIQNFNMYQQGNLPLNQNYQTGYQPGMIMPNPLFANR